MATSTDEDVDALNAVVIVFPDIAKKATYEAAGGERVIHGVTSIVIHELLDHGLDFIRNGNIDSSDGPEVKNVKYQNAALEILGKPLRLKHKH